MDRIATHPRLVAAVILAVMAWAGLMGATPAHAQTSSDYDVLVPRLAAINGARGNFGRDVSNEFKKLLEQSPEYDPVESGDIKQALQALQLHEDSLSNCITARQFAGREGIRLVMCGTFEPAPSGEGFRITAQIISPESNAEFQAEPFVSNDKKAAAQQIFAEFTEWTQVLANTSFCGDYLNSQQYDQALENCDKALAIDPNHKPAKFFRAQALQQLGRKDEALAEYEKMLAENPFDQELLYRTALLAMELEKVDVARQHFTKYLELDPDNAAVRMKVAGDQADAGDHEGALTVVEQGMKGDSVDAALQAYAGGLALQAAQKRAETDSTSARPFYQKAIQYMLPTYEANGAQTEIGVLTNMLVAYIALGDLQQTADFAAKVLETHPDNAQIWVLYAQTLQKLGQTAQALEAINKAEAQDPQARVQKMKVAILLQSGQSDGLADAARKSVANGEWTGDEAAQQIAISGGYNQKAKNNKFAEAVQYYEIAREFAQSDLVKAQVNLFHGHALINLHRAPLDKDRPTCADARATLPQMERAREYITNAAAYTDQATVRAQLLEQVGTFIEIATLIRDKECG
jgi:tetratricopeptide (TPR) repeat protein